MGITIGAYLFFSKFFINTLVNIKKLYTKEVMKKIDIIYLHSKNNNKIFLNKNKI